MQIMRLPITIKMPSFQKNVTIKEIVLHKSASTIIPALCLTFSRTRIFTPTIKTNLHRQNSSNLQRSQTNCKLITFPKLSQKKEESGD